MHSMFIGWKDIIIVIFQTMILHILSIEFNILTKHHLIDPEQKIQRKNFNALLDYRLKTNDMSKIIFWNNQTMVSIKGI